jgi:hypothetical protein
VRVRYLEPYDDNKVIVWDRVADAVEEHDYNQDTHSSLRPPFDYDQGWIVSVRTGRRLLWLPQSRRPFFDNKENSFATHGNLIATGSGDGVVSLMDMSPFAGK